MAANGISLNGFEQTAVRKLSQITPNKCLAPDHRPHYVTSLRPNSRRLIRPRRLQIGRIGFSVLKTV